jgi:opacity protein-like surface antigen
MRIKTVQEQSSTSFTRALKNKNRAQDNTTNRVSSDKTTIMKKAILFSVAAAITSMTATTATAQKGFYVGAQGAGQVSVMANKTDVDKNGTDYESKMGKTIGIGGGYNFNEHMGVGTEVMYSTMKQKFTDNGSSITQKFNYLKVPVLFTYNTNPAKKFMFTAKAGPQLGILLKSEISEASNRERNGDTKDQYKKVTFGAMAGAGVRMKVTDHISLDAGLRFDGSIGDTENKDYKGYAPGRAKSHDLNAGLEVGVKYFL